MGYKKSFNLVTLQLIIPLSTMTKAEYKNAYGIDLDDIDIERVTLLQEDGSKNKYFVDEIKTTESGIDIYAGGKVLSIGSSVSVVNNAYSVENAKPIYCHPVLLTWNLATSSGYIQFLLFNNVSEAYTTWSSLVTYLKSFNGLIMLSGGINSIADSKILIATTLRNTGTSVLAYGMETDGTIINSSKYKLDDIPDSSMIVSDLVNKIN